MKDLDFRYRELIERMKRRLDLQEDGGHDIYRILHVDGEIEKRCSEHCLLCEINSALGIEVACD